MSIERLYRYSRAVAAEMDDLEEWRKSYKCNCECKAAIEKAISENFDGYYLDDSAIKPVLDEYGYDRTMWVLAATIRCKEYDGRFARSNKEWAKEIIPDEIPTEEMWKYAVGSHPAVLDGFVSEVRKAYKAIGLLDKSKCIVDDKE